MAQHEHFEGVCDDASEHARIEAERRISDSQVYPDATEPPAGLYQRYVVEKADGSPVDPRAMYFVLRLDEYGDDETWISCCRDAAWHLVSALRRRHHMPKVADDLEAYLDGIEGR